MTKNIFSLKFLIPILFVLVPFSVQTQNPLRFEDEVFTITLNNSSFLKNDSTVLFTGSSSIRIWTDIHDYFPNYMIINTGFGGSQMSDLYYYSTDLIFKYLPKKIFIYEGDNDIASGKSPKDILATSDSLIKLIKTSIPGAEIYIISAKPSLARWLLKKEFTELNQLYLEYCNKFSDVNFVNIWDTMLNERKIPREDIFIEDGLHMNKKGYDLWAKKIKEFLYD